MVRPRNYYRNYRGRRTKGKAALAALLVLVILAAVVVILLQRNIVYDETGSPRLDVPWQEETEEQDRSAAELDLVIQPPKEEDAVLCGFSVSTPLNRETWALSLRQAQDVQGDALNAVLVTMKDSGGHVYFDSAVADPDAVQFREEETGVALTALLDRAAADKLHAIARMNCFQDSVAAKNDVDAMGLTNTAGYMFYDSQNGQWLDPAKAGAREYLCKLAGEVAELGFDELLLTGVCYPIAGNLEEVAYGETAKTENLSRFLEEMRVALEPYGVRLSLELPAEVILSGSNDAYGLNFAEAASKVDCIFVKTTSEEAAALADAVKAVNEEIGFVPILTEDHPAWTGSYLTEPNP